MDLVEINLHSGMPIKYYVCPTLHAMLCGDLVGLQIQLYSGRKVKEYEMAIWNSYGVSCSTLKFDFKCHDNLPNATYLMQLDALYDYEDEDEFPPDFFRRSVVHEVIVFLQKYFSVLDAEVQSSMVKGFHLVWRSRVTPFVRIHEVFCVLREDWINVDCPARCYIKLRMACVQYGILFDNIAAGSLSPRSLKHLSRCAVRDTLINSSGISEVHKLNIPKLLKSYLLLES